MTGVVRLAWVVASAVCSTGGVALLAHAWRWTPPTEHRPATSAELAAQSGLFAIPPTDRDPS